MTFPHQNHGTICMLPSSGSPGQRTSSFGPRMGWVPPNPIIEHHFSCRLISKNWGLLPRIKQRNQSFQAPNTAPRGFRLEIPGSLAVLLVRHCPAQVPFVPKSHIVSRHVRFGVIHSPGLKSPAVQMKMVPTPGEVVSRFVITQFS